MSASAVIADNLTPVAKSPCSDSWSWYHGRLDLRPLLTHTFPLERITEAYKLFGECRDVIKVAIKPN